jgi:hypothetical protein
MIGGLENTRSAIQRWNKMWVRFGSVAAVISLCSCSLSGNYSDAVNATKIFHGHMDGGDYTAVYDAATKGFQASGTRDNLIGFLTRVNRKLGKCGEATAAFGGYQATTSGTFVTMTSSRVCTNGTLNEQFVWLMIEGKATLLKYNANSPLLLTD